MTLWGEPDLLYVQSFEQLHAGIRNCDCTNYTQVQASPADAAGHGDGMDG